ncbi:MAG: hypothetical protein JXA46_05260 [Dehalococcoidales bacterium]|nr:hypothetical protein [Dehalococcoidales bacterium]
MKLSIAQIVLGILIAAASCYITGWMIFGVQSLLTIPVPDESSFMSRMNVLPRHETLFTLARYASGLVFGLGLAVLLTGAFQNSTESGRKLAISQIIAGVLIPAVSYFIIIWGYPTEFRTAGTAGSNLIKHVFINPGPVIMRAEMITLAIFSMGLAVLGIGLAQLLKAIKEHRG